MKPLDAAGICGILKNNDPDAVRELFQKADQVRRKFVGDRVHLRGLVEFSNRCKRGCLYCGISREHREVKRYLMSRDEILRAVENVCRAGFGTVVLQSGEGAMGPDDVEELIRSIRSRFDLAITLSLGEQSRETLARWKEAGANRYLLRFETGQEDLFEKIHPGTPRGGRIQVLCWLKELGYEAGTGIMVGLPCQTWEGIAGDLITMKELDVDMIGLGPYVPHPETPLGREYFKGGNNLVPNTVQNALKVLALARILLPDVNIPSTTAIATLDEDGRTSGLNAGANVVMPNLTPAIYRAMYEIYPKKNAEFSDESPEQIRKNVEIYLKSIGRTPGTGWGNRKVCREAGGSHFHETGRPENS